MNDTDLPNSIFNTTAGPEVTKTSRLPVPSTEAYIISVILFIFCILGTVGNALAFLIYYRKRDKGTSTIFILSLAVADFLTCLILIPFTIATELLVYKHNYEVICRVYIWLQTMVIPLSSLIMVAIGIDRYFCICHPFMRAVTVPRAKVILVILTLLSVALGIVPSLGHSVYQLETVEVKVSHENFTDDLALNDSVSDALFQTGSDGSAFFNAASPPPGQQSLTATTVNPPVLYTNGLDLSPVQDFLDSMNQPMDHPSSAPTQPGPGYLITGNNSVNIIETVANSSVNSTSLPYMTTSRTKITYFAYCYRSEVLLTMAFVNIYQKVYAAIFLVEFIILALLYALIYRSILVRRAWKAKRKRMSCYASTVNGPGDEVVAEETQLTQINHAVGNVDGQNGSGPAANHTNAPNAETVLLNPKKKDAKSNRVSAAVRDRALYANIKTAAMLFVVTVGFVVSFLPSWLMGLKVFPFNMVVFYMFYINNVINPFIYAFMNRTFRDDLVTLLKGCLRR